MSKLIEKLDGNLKGHNERCYYCDEPCDHFAGNPGLWPICLPQEQRPKWHHTKCVKLRLDRLAALADGEIEEWILDIASAAWHTANSCHDKKPKECLKDAIRAYLNALKEQVK